MDNHRGRLGLGILLLLAGTVLLLQNLGVFGPFAEKLIGCRCSAWPAWLSWQSSFSIASAGGR